MLKILEMDEEELLALWPEHIDRMLTPEEILHIFKKLKGFWSYDYKAADNGKPGRHALLKSELHSDGFLNSYAVLKYYNLCRIMAQQLVWTWNRKNLPRPTKVAGIPRGASELGQHVAHLMGAKAATMVKDNGKIKLQDELFPSDTLLLVEDFCTRGTGFKEAVSEIFNYHHPVYPLPYELVIINRGDLRNIETEDRSFKIITPVHYRISDYDPDTEGCPMCDRGSQPTGKENWEMLINSQT